MADADYGDAYTPPGGTGRGQKVMNMLGAAASVALIAGLGWWGYDLAMRDARGVPVVRALEGPMRVAPEDPGGEVVDHQGLSVNNVAAVGAAAPPPDRLVLAPPPVELTLEDGPGLSGLPPAPDETAQPARMDNPDRMVPVAPEALPEGTDPAVAAALAEALGADEGTPEAVVETAALDADGLPPPKGRSPGHPGRCRGLTRAPTPALSWRTPRRRCRP